MSGNRKWRNFLNKFHVYGGLFSVGFLIAFSISAFYHQHHPKFPKPGDKTAYWEQSIMVPDIPDNLDFKFAVRDSLGLFGHAPWWEDYHDNSGVHHFLINRPGKKYWITVPDKGHVYKVEEVRTGIWPVFIALHYLASGMQNVGEKPFFIKAWRIISLPMALVVLGVVIITIHFWRVRSFRKKRSWIIVGAIATIPIILFIFIWVLG